MSSKINLQTCEYARKSSIFQDNQLILYKKVVLFATSGGSDMGKTAEKLQPYLGSEAEIVDAKVKNENPSLKALKAWAVY